MVNEIHTVIFDLDGTLSDSAILTTSAMRKLSPEYGLPMPSEDAIRSATGYANPEFYYLLFPDFPRDTVRDFGNCVENEELRVLPLLGGRLLFEGCREMLENLKECGIRLCIASTGDRGHVFSVLNETGIINLFDTVFCGSPDKNEMLRGLVRDGSKDGYLMVGDMKKDHEAAKVNGILSAGACYGYCKRDLTDFDFYVDTPGELLHMLQIKGG